MGCDGDCIFLFEYVGGVDGVNFMYFKLSESYDFP